jgi:hypothetical protein
VRIFSPLPLSSLSLVWITSPILLPKRGLCFLPTTTSRIVVSQDPPQITEYYLASTHKFYTHMMNNLCRQVQASVQRWGGIRSFHVLGRSSSLSALSSLTSSSSSLTGTAPATTSGGRRACGYHTTPVTRNPANKTPPTNRLGNLFTDDILAEIEYHHDRRDVTNLNLFLKHPSTPKIMGWHPDLVFDGDDNTLLPRESESVRGVKKTSTGTVTTSTSTKATAAKATTTTTEQHQGQDTAAAETPKPIWRAATTNTMIPWSCMNRNSRRPRKANKGKRPCSSVGRKARTRKLGNPKRK